MFLEKDSTAIDEFPANADVRILIKGLALCEFGIGTSKINFLRHIPYHELTLEIIKKRRGSNTAVEHTIIRPLPYVKNITITQENAIQRTSIKAYGEDDLNELVNFNDDQLHNRNAVFKDSLPLIHLPTILTINNCVFYTASKSTKEFHIKERKNPTPIKTKHIGLTLGGKIRYATAEGKTIITIGSNKLPELLKKDAAGNEFIYDIIFTNHCGNENSSSDPYQDLCENLMGNDTDFRFYYDLLEHKKEEKKKFTLEKKASSSKSGNKIIPEDKTVDVGACNVAVIKPPPGDIPPADPEP